MFPLIGTLVMSVAGHLLGKAAGNAWDARKTEAAKTGPTQSGQSGFSAELAKETQRLAQAPGTTASDAPSALGLPPAKAGLPPAKADVAGIRQLLVDRFEAP